MVIIVILYLGVCCYKYKLSYGYIIWIILIKYINIYIYTSKYIYVYVYICLYVYVYNKYD